MQSLPCGGSVVFGAWVCIVGQVLAPGALGKVFVCNRAGDGSESDAGEQLLAQGACAFYKDAKAPSMAAQRGPSLARDALLQAQALIALREVAVCNRAGADIPAAEQVAALLFQADASANTGLPREKVATTGEIRATASAEQLAATSIMLASSPGAGHWRSPWAVSGSRSSVAIASARDSENSSDPR